MYGTLQDFHSYTLFFNKILLKTEICKTLKIYNRYIDEEFFI